MEKSVIAVYAGSFDPITLGHLDIITRASRTFSKVIVGIGVNRSKTSKTSFFLPGDRKTLILRVCEENKLDNVEVEIFSTLTVDFCRERKASIIVRGLRFGSEFENELNIAHTNSALCPEVDTIFFGTALALSFVASSTAKEVSDYKGNLSLFVPDLVADAMRKKISG